MRRIRSPAVAGTFYPANPATLGTMVDGFLAEAAAGSPQRRKPVCAVIAPHAGYVYSGPVAGRAFAAMRRNTGDLRRVVVIGPSHFVPIRGLAAPSAESFRTPLGDVALDELALARLTGLMQVRIADRPHADEHAIEVELPFLQRLASDFLLVPLVVGRARPEEVAEVLAALSDDEPLIVVSSDLSHYESYASAKRHDAETATAIETLDHAALEAADACGHAAIAGLLLEAKRRGLEVERLDLRNSGDTAGPKDRVVGYGAWAFS